MAATHIERAFEAHECPKMGYAPGELGRVEEHREGTV
jgi:hypothetical protein